MKWKLTHHDVLASVVVFLVALPLCMGIALASGVPPERGLVTGIIGGIVVGLIGGSPLQVSGPAAGLAVIILELVNQHGLAMLGPVLVLAGLIQLGAGTLRLGVWFRAMSPAVIHGMLAGIGILIFAGQFHVAVDDRPRENGIQNLLSIPESFIKGVVNSPDTTHHEAALVGFGTIVILMLWNQFRPKALKLIPGALVGVVLATVASAYLGLPIKLITLPETLAQAVQFPTPESFLKLLHADLLLEALALAFIASAETLLSAAAVDQMHKGARANFDRELSAQGVGNMICGFLGALPMTGVIVRSSANVQAGARTKWSAILHGIWLLGMVVLAPHILRLIPTAALAGILVYTGIKLIDIHHIQRLREYGRWPLAIYAGTVIGIVATDLLTGVLIGLALTVLEFIYNATHLQADLRLTPESNRADLELTGAATFLALPSMVQVLGQVPNGTELHICVEKVTYFDHSAMDLLRHWQEQQADYGGRLVIDWDGVRSMQKRPNGNGPQLPEPKPEEVNV